MVKDALKQKYRLVEKAWDSKYDMNRFSSGVFNLDQLCIKERSTTLTTNQQRELESILKHMDYLPETLDRQGYIILDGVEFELLISTNEHSKYYKWKLASDEVRNVEPLINFLANIYFS